jgi:hypothetical protein
METVRVIPRVTVNAGLRAIAEECVRKPVRCDGKKRLVVRQIELFYYAIMPLIAKTVSESVMFRRGISRFA